MHALLTACLLHCYQSPEYTQALLSEGGHAPAARPPPRAPPATQETRWPPGSQTGWGTIAHGPRLPPEYAPNMNAALLTTGPTGTLKCGHKCACI